MSRDRLLRILAENKLDPAIIEPVWTEPWPDVKRHLFVPHTTSPRFLLDVDVWKPVINAYFAWYCIPREQCTHVWTDIVDMLLRLPPGMSGNADFRAWAYGCLCKFYLEDRKGTKQPDNAQQVAPSCHPTSQYDPAENWKI
jgi:hypothetical protein